jgi:xyloglucan-specific endo-beta-1,4-glucanase
MRKAFRNAGLGLLCAGLIAGCSEDVLDGSRGGDQGYARAVLQECVKDKTIVVGASYKLNNNLWGAGTSGAGSQCVWYDNVSGKWGVNSSHTSGTAQNIKGYPALVRGWLWYNSSGSIWASSTDTTFPVALNRIASFHSNWTVTVPQNGEKYNTSYDIWMDASNNPNHKAQYEIMVWINYKGPAYNGSDFLPIGPKIASNVTVAGHVWNVYRGWNGTNNVFTFRRATNTNSVSNLNLLALLNYARNQGFVPANYYVLGVQAGFEIVSGGAFRTESFTSTLTKL